MSEDTPIECKSLCIIFKGSLLDLVVQVRETVERAFEIISDKFIISCCLTHVILPSHFHQKRRQRAALILHQLR